MMQLIKVYTKITQMVKFYANIIKVLRKNES